MVELLKPATAKWHAGDRVEYRVPLALPADNAFDDGELVSIRVGFVPKNGGEVLTLGKRWEDWLDEDGLTEVASIDAPRFAGADGPVRLNEIIEEAALLRRKGDAPAAWAMLDEAFRAAASDVTKARAARTSSPRWGSCRRPRSARSRMRSSASGSAARRCGSSASRRAACAAEASSAR